jgi:hypothetical protein
LFTIKELTLYTSLQHTHAFAIPETAQHRQKHQFPKDIHSIPSLVGKLSDHLKKDAKISLGPPFSLNGFLGAFPPKTYNNVYFSHFPSPPFRGIYLSFHVRDTPVSNGRIYMRFVFFFLVGLLLWAGTVSINYGSRTSGTPSTILSCSGKEDGETLLDYLHTGRITGIRDNGHILTISLTPQWSTLPTDIQHHTQEAVACYARAQQRDWQFIGTP